MRLSVPEPIIYACLCLLLCALYVFFSSSCTSWRCVIGSVRVWESSRSESLPGSVSGLGRRVRRPLGGGGTHSGSISAFSTERVALSGHLSDVEDGGWKRRGRGRGRGRGRVIPLPQVRGWTGERSHYEESWALSVFSPPSLVQSFFLPLISPGKCVCEQFVCLCLLMNVRTVVIHCALFVWRIKLEGYMEVFICIRLL